MLFPLYSSAQIMVTESDDAANSPQIFVENILAGLGIDVISVNYIGDPQALGSFTGAAEYLGMEAGIMLSTGKVSSLPLPGSGTISYNFQSGPEHYPDLTSSPANIFDLAALEIEFIPNGNVIEIDWLFGSEEYPVYMTHHSTFSDVFGIFLSGPGITGPYSNNSKRINLLGNGQPFTSATLSNNPSIFNLNNQSTSPPFFNIFTMPFTASHEVTSGETYTLRIAIADLGDGAVDSGVLLRTNSLRVADILNTETPESLDNGFNIIYPNPASGDVKIAFNLAVQGNVKFDVFDAAGKLLYTHNKETLAAGEHTITIPAIHFPTAGVYFIRMESESVNGVQKLIYKP